MRLCQSLLVTTAVLALAGGSATGDTFTSKEGRFTVSMPAKPTIAESKVQAGAESMVMHTFSVEAKGGSFAVVYSDLPASVPVADRVDNILDGSANGIVTNTKGTLVESNKIERSGCPGRDVTWSVQAKNASLRGRAYLFLVGHRLYQVLAVGEESFVASKSATEFLDSFKFEPLTEVNSSTRVKAPKRAETEPKPEPTTPASGPPAAWREFDAKNNDGGYSVQVPSRPERDQAPGILGTKNSTRFRCSAEGLTFTILGQPVNDAALKMGAKALLKASRESLASAQGGKVKNDKSIKVAEFDACEFRITSAPSSSNITLARSVLAGRRLYTLYVTGSETAVSGPSASKFLNSFNPTR